MSSFFGLGDGASFAHTCGECGGTVTVLAPEKNGHGNDARAWGQWRKLIRSQVTWPLLCPACKAWWNERVGVT